MKNKRIIAGLLATAISLSLVSCGDVPAETTGGEIIVCPADMFLPEPDTDASFADNLMKMTESDGNRMLSPYSAKMCLALLANGADGETKQQILDAIGISDINSYNAEVKVLLERYASYEAAMALNTANSIWINQTTFDGKGAFLPDYRTAMQDFYSAEVREVTDKNSVEEVNAWAKEKTNGKIDSILTEEHRSFATVLTNAVYFKAAWEAAFSEYMTAKEIFTNADGSTAETDFMHNTDSFGYYEADGIKAVKLDYSRFGEGESYVSDQDYDFSMYFILSDEMPEIEELLDTVEFTSSRVRLSIPKFEINYDISMNDILKALGMTNAFDAVLADFSEMIDLTTLNDNLVVDDVLQKTYIKIDEEGTEAAAVTAIVMVECAAVIDESPIKEFNANKPFYFAVRDNTSGEILFVGRYETVE